MDLEGCTGCGACKAVCPTKAIEMRQGREGFLFPEIKKELCIHCGKCDETCPLYKKSKENVSFGKKIFAAWSLDTTIRWNSTSGGIFSELAKSILKEQGCIVGVAYQDDFQPVYQGIEKEEELYRLRQSKYVEAGTENEFLVVKEWLKQGRKVLFVGTPCKIAGLKSILGEEAQQLYTCDFICRGNNAPYAYKKYLESLENQYGSKIQKIWFKNKKDGWNHFGTQIDFENGAQYFANRYEDSYMRGYLKHNLYLRDSCTNCNFKNQNRYADITLADFWGIQIPEELTEVEKGVSMISLNSEKGEQLWNRICSNVGYISTDSGKAIANNSCAKVSVCHGSYREYFWEKLTEGKDFQELIWEIEQLNKR
ncbi:MAG: Coenzyme F420 hydrogenase/dehydrogenase, beta subunit C-terminal domain [Acetivibrio ethanolgignens]